MRSSVDTQSDSQVYPVCCRRQDCQPRTIQDRDKAGLERPWAEDRRTGPGSFGRVENTVRPSFYDTVGALS